VRAAIICLLLAACAHDQELSVRYESKITSDRDAFVCRYYERKLIELYAAIARVETEAEKKTLDAELTAIEGIFEQRCIKPAN